MWPKTIEIQKEFGSDVEIILVNKFERERFIREYLLKRKKMDWGRNVAAHKSPGFNYLEIFS